VREHPFIQVGAEVRRQGGLQYRQRSAVSISRRGGDGVALVQIGRGEELVSRRLGYLGAEERERVAHGGGSRAA
jgi:hypothetical protein